MAQPLLPRRTLHARRRLPASLALISILVGVILTTIVFRYSRPTSNPPDDVDSIAGETWTLDERPARRINSSLMSTIEHLDAQAAKLEDRHDVKCWTSFKLLETFIASCQLAPETTHLKTEVVLNYLDQIWAKADRATIDRSTIYADTFKQTVQQVVPWETDLLLEYRIKFPEQVVRIRYQDVQNYHSTVEPIRQLQTLVRHLATNQPQRKGLSSDAILEASHLAALLNTLVLREANIVARENQHQQVMDDDVLEADRRIARALQIRTLDLAKRKQPSVVAASGAPGDEKTMLSIVGQKIHSLRTFNTTYSRDNLAETFVADLAAHEKEWAKLPIESSASNTYKTSDLVDLAEFLYESCAQLHPGHDPLTGAQMFDDNSKVLSIGDALRTWDDSSFPQPSKNAGLGGGGIRGRRIPRLSLALARHRDDVAEDCHETPTVNGPLCAGGAKRIPIGFQCCVCEAIWPDRPKPYRRRCSRHRPTGVQIRTSFVRVGERRSRQNTERFQERTNKSYRCTASG